MARTSGARTDGNVRSLAAFLRATDGVLSGASQGAVIGRSRVLGESFVEGFRLGYLQARLGPAQRVSLYAVVAASSRDYRVSVARRVGRSAVGTGPLSVARFDSVAPVPRHGYVASR